MLNRLMGRLEFVSILIRSSFLALLSMTVYPILRFLIPPNFQLPRDTSIKAAKLSELPLNSAKIFPFRNRPAILIHTSADEFKAFSAVCTHLNCTVQYDDKSQVILCACHNGRYGLDGQVISGPPPKPLEEFKIILQRDEIIVSKGL